MRKPFNLLYIALLTIGWQGCISDYTPADMEEVSNILVVESTITNGTTDVRLTRSIGLLDYIANMETVDNAMVYVETEDGSVLKQGVFKEKGKYTVETGDLNLSAKYRLRVAVDGLEYASGYLEPVVTPEIDSINWQKKGQGAPVYMCVSSHGTQEQSPYYRWSFNEHWEVKAEYYANAAKIRKGLGEDEIVYFDLASSNNRYYCWGRDSSRILLLDSSEKLNENIISQKRLTEIAPTDERLSILYYISVKQTSLRKQAYDYFRNVQKNIEQTGGLFSPIPSESKGNIKCISDPGIYVIGYVEVATTTEKGHYVPFSDGLFESKKTECADLISSDPKYADVFEFYQYNPPAEVLYAPASCVNCLTKYKATKNKPSWWPTAHL